MVFKLIHISSLFIGEYIKFKLKNLINKYFKNIPCIERVEFIKKVIEKIEKVNIIYIKLLQSLCINKKLLYDNEKDYLLKYTDNVPFNSDDIDYKLLGRLERCYNIQLSPEPLNSGIVSVVFKGIYSDNNNKVIIKILKKNIHSKLIEVFHELYTGARLLSYIPYIKSLNIQKVLDDNKEIILNQTNFKCEVDNIIIFKEKNLNIDEFKIPVVYEEITDVFENIIVMEDIKGLTYKEIENYDAYTKNEFGKLILKFGLISILYNSAIHCDLHPGNIFFYINDENTNENTKFPKYQIGIIDFGIVSFPNKNNQNLYYEIFKEIFIEEKFSDCIFQKSLENIFEPKDIIDKLVPRTKITMINKINVILKEYSETHNIINTLIKISKILNTYNIKFSNEFNQLFLSLQIAINMATNLCTDILEEQKVIFNELNKVNTILKFD